MSKAIKNKHLRQRTAAFSSFLLVIMASCVELSAAQADPAQTYTKTFTKSDRELKSPANPNAGKDLYALVRDQFSSFASKITANQKTGNERLVSFVGDTAEPTRKVYLAKLGTFRDAPVAQTLDVATLNTFLQGQTTRAGGDRIREEFPIYNQFKSGLAFNMDVKSLFGASSNRNSDEKSAANRKVHYTLVVKDILPEHASPRYAALGESNFAELESAGHAKVIWSLEPTEVKESARVFAFEEELPETTTQKKTFLERMFERMPDPSFSGRVEPLTGDAGGDVSGKSPLQDFKLSLNQTQGYYVATLEKHATTETTLTHNLRVPLYGDMAFGRKVDKSGKPLQTSLFNVWGMSAATPVNVHFIDSERRYKVESTVSRGSQTFTLELFSVVDQKLKPTPEFARTWQRSFVDTCNLKYSTLF